jgi:HEXXH motif-containing protein
MHPIVDVSPDSESSRLESLFSERLDWRRLAATQEDQYDTDVVLALAERRGFVRVDSAGKPRFLGRIAITNSSPNLAPDCDPTTPDHPNIAAAEELIRLWPAMAEQLPRLTDQLNLFLHEKSPYLDDGVGSMSNAGDGRWGTISSTINSAVGFAGSLVHEMAHHKLRALGVEFESAEHLILNPSEQRFRSPVRYDCLRPMSAVLHGQYAFLYSAEMCLRIVQADRDSARGRRVATDALAVKLPKLVFGLEVLNSHAITDENGAEFLEGLNEWCLRLFEEGFDLLKEMGISMKRFAHPLSV